MIEKLTKTDFINFLKCPREFWLLKHHPNAFGAPSPDQVFRGKQGYEVEKLARQFLSSAVDFPLINWKSAETEKLSARFDVFVEDAGDGGAHIYEIKSSKFRDAEDSRGKQTREEHLYDLAFQVFAARESGLTISKAFLVTLNGEYVLGDELDLEELFVFEDVTVEIEARQEIVRAKIVEAIDLLGSKPSADFENLCGKKLGCEYLRFALPDFPARTISEIPRLQGERFSGLLEMSVVDLFDVPKDYKLTTAQRDFVDFVQTGVLDVKREKIAELLDELEYPLYFLDYETVNPSIPQFKGMSPLEQITFQYSLHVKVSPDSDLVHLEFLSDGSGEPPREIAENLASVIGEKGSVVVWYKSFEMSRNDEMARLCPEFAEFFASVNSRVFDLYEIFKQKLYRDPAFKNNSIKSVLPILVPELSYDELEIGNGGLAMSLWFEKVYCNTDETRKKQTMRALREYCALDTLAMVRILEFLQNL